MKGYQEKLRAILSWPLVGRVVDQLNLDQVQTVVVWLQDLAGELKKTICFVVTLSRDFVL